MNGFSHLCFLILTIISASALDAALDAERKGKALSGTFPFKSLNDRASNQAQNRHGEDAKTIRGVFPFKNNQDRNQAAYDIQQDWSNKTIRGVFPFKHQNSANQLPERKSKVLQGSFPFKNQQDLKDNQSANDLLQDESDKTIRGVFPFKSQNNRVANQDVEKKDKVLKGTFPFLNGPDIEKTGEVLKAKFPFKNSKQPSGISAAGKAANPVDAAEDTTNRAEKNNKITKETSTPKNLNNHAEDHVADHAPKDAVDQAVNDLADQTNTNKADTADSSTCEFSHCDQTDTDHAAEPDREKAVDQASDNAVIQAADNAANQASEKNSKIVDETPRSKTQHNHAANHASHNPENSDDSDLASVQRAEIVPLRDPRQEGSVDDKDLDIGSIAAAGERCVDKVVMITEMEYDTEINCKHSYSEKCHTTYTTDYEPNQEEECVEFFKKNCFISYKNVAFREKVEFCRTPLICDGEGPEECRTVYEFQCETRYEEHDVEEDAVNCKTIQEEKCEDVTDGYTTEEKCTSWPKQVCSTEKAKAKKYSPETRCKTVPQELCGPASCILKPGPKECIPRIQTVVSERPEETCNLEPQKECKHVTKLVPHLQPREECVDIPKEVCARNRINPRKITRPVVKKWCYVPTAESGLA